MTAARDPTLRVLDDCGCCEGVGMRAPVEIFNRAGLAAIAYRLGTHSRFKETMLARLSARDLPALRALRTRADDDFAIGLLDSWAMVADVLSFYQERIANESYLRTATEDRSLHRLAQLIGYVPRSGVAASVYLAFTIERAAGAPAQTTVPVGTRAQSIPGPGQTPQVFETVEAIEARPEWNALRPRLTRAQSFSTGMESVLLAGLGTPPKIGSLFLFVGTENGSDYAVKRAVRVITDTERGTTQVDFVAAVQIADPPQLPTFNIGTISLQPAILTASLITNSVIKTNWSQGNLAALALIQNWPLAFLANNISAQRVAPPSIAGKTGIFALRQRAAIFGHNAPQFLSLTPEQQTRLGGAAKDWDNTPPSIVDNGFIYLDRVYEDVIPGSWLVFESTQPASRVLHKVVAVEEVSRAGYTLSAKVSRLLLESTGDLSSFKMRSTTVYIADTEPLSLAPLPMRHAVPDNAERNRIVLEDPELRLSVGRKLIITGENSDLDGVTESEVLTIADVSIIDGYTQLSFTKALEHRYKRDTVSLNANIALATHGEHKQEIIGSGDGNLAFQRFALRQPPLTYVAAENASGAAAALEIRVDELKWQEVFTLHGHGPDERVYTVRTDADGRSVVQFGDGRTGALLPTGVENVVASYRKEIGEDGLVDANQISLLMTRPLGVRGVTNPLAPAGAEDRERLEQIRRNATLPIKTLDRIVSLQDYEDFARAFGGVAKALATWSWDGQRRRVFVTVAGPKGAAIDDGGRTHAALMAAMENAGDSQVGLHVQSYRPAFFRVEARVQVHADYGAQAVLAAVEETLRAQFGFEAREFGQPVTRSEVVAAMQGVDGVVAVDIDYLFRTDDPISSLTGVLLSAAPRTGPPLVAAELLLLDPRPLALGEMT